MEIPAVLTFDPQWFPDPSLALTEPNGLLAVGGDLSTTRLIHAYHQGIFPWSSDAYLLLWWSPNPRAVIYLDEFKCAKSLQKLIRKQPYKISFDQACDEVIQACASTRDEASRWLTDDMISSYQSLHQQGHVHSVEVWDGDDLVGGLYGVVIGKIFCGESMFSTLDNTSKIALAYLVWQLRQWDFALIDCQIPNAHLTRLGARLIPRESFLSLLKQHEHDTQTIDWSLNRDYFDDIVPVF